MICQLSQIRKEDVLVVGGKGANLGELTAAKINVPKGFVITSAGYKTFLKENNIDVATGNGCDVATGNGRDVVTGTSHDVATGTSRDVATGNGHDVATGNGRDVATGNGCDVAIENGCDVATGDGRDVAIENGFGPWASQEKILLKEAEVLRGKITLGVFPKELQQAIRENYFKLGENARVAVRSSATAEDLPEASFAGQQETYLNVQGIEDVLEAVRNCYCSLWSNRAVSYRFHQGYDQTKVAIAVVVQEMVESEKAGVLFTSNPLNGKDDEMEINANYGLGESVVSGRVSADSYMVDKAGRILASNIGSKEREFIYGEKGTVEVPVSEDKKGQPVLTDDEILMLVKDGLKIEKHYGMPMDIEWAIKSHQVYILQARPITALNKAGDDKIDDILVEKYIKHEKISKSTREVMAFFLEKMPFAHRALDFDYLMAINDQKNKIFAEAGIILPRNPVIDNDGIQTFSNGRRRLGKDIFRLPAQWKNMRNFQLCCKKCKIFMRKYEEDMARIKQLDFNNMSLVDCGDFLEESYFLLQNLAYDRFKCALFPSILSEKKLTKIIKKVDSNYSAFDFYWGLDNKTSVVTHDFYTMAKEISGNHQLKQALISGVSFDELKENYRSFKEITDKFLEKNGFKSDYNCYCLASKTFFEEPDRLVSILRPLVEGENLEEDKEKKDFTQLMESLKKIYGKNYPAIERQVSCFRYFHVVREESQYLWETLSYYLRQCVKRMNMILVGNENYDLGVGNLFHKELKKTIRRGYLSEVDKENIRRRNEKFPLAEKVWERSKLLIFTSNDDILKGVSGSGGLAAGKASLINSPKEFYKMKKGDVLVCHFTDPEWTPLFKLASAVVADTGSALSHAAIVAREYNIPAVLGVGFATTKFKDGDLIQVDGDSGWVKRLEK